MQIKATKLNSEFLTEATFLWNNELTDCYQVSHGVEDDDFDALIKGKVHEGSDLAGWKVEIDLTKELKN